MHPKLEIRGLLTRPVGVGRQPAIACVDLATPLHCIMISPGYGLPAVDDSGIGLWSQTLGSARWSRTLRTLGSDWDSGLPRLS